MALDATDEQRSATRAAAAKYARAAQIQPAVRRITAAVRPTGADAPENIA
jgi:hypothetical protein